MKRLILLGGVLIIADQLTKYAISGSRIFLADGIALKYHENTGAAFSILQGATMFLIAASIITLMFILYYYFQLPGKKGQNSLASLGLIFLFSGTAGNLIDRASLGFVRDFIAIWKWPVFNLADAFTTMGASLIVLTLLRDELKKRRIKRFK